MHVAAVTEIVNSLIPAMEELRDALDAKAKSFDHIIKIGRTHLQASMPSLEKPRPNIDSAPQIGCYSFDLGSRI